MFRPAALIGIYNHGDTIADVVRPLCAQALPILVVDDGSDAHTRARLDELKQSFPEVRVERLPVNSGKGAALIHGFEILSREGFTHALVLDADGQHDTSDASVFLDAARCKPEALILGRPIFDDSAPKSRLYGRRISQFWVHIETLSFAIADPLCGFRCYPLLATSEVLPSLTACAGMEIDTEIAVRMAWHGVPMVNVPTKVGYPVGGISHFRVWRDNFRISWMHTRLVLGMLRRAPWILASRSIRAPERRLHERS